MWKSEFLSPWHQYFNSLCSLLRGNKNVFKWIVTEHWTSQKKFFSRKKLLCYRRDAENNLLSMSLDCLNFWHLYDTFHAVTKMVKIIKTNVRLQKGKWQFDTWMLINNRFMVSLEIFLASQISLFYVHGTPGNMHFFENATNKKWTLKTTRVVCLSHFLENSFKCKKFFFQFKNSAFHFSNFNFKLKRFKMRCLLHDF